MLDKVHASIPVLALATTLAAQASFTQLFPAVSPQGRAGIHAVTDGGGMVIFGGLTVGGSLPQFTNDLWRFDGTSWTQLTTAASPPARDWYASSWDALRNRYVLFGGRTYVGTTATDLGDTWEYDGVNWTQLLPANAPSARRWSAMVFDYILGKNVLFGGSAGGTVFHNDTWAWDGSNWAQLNPANNPGARARGWFAYDLSRQRAMYFGGKNSSSSLALSDTWFWDGLDWTQVQTTVQPGWNAGAGLIAYGLTFDPLRDRYVLFGGTRTTASTSNQLFEFDGSDWIDRGIQANVPSRTAPGLVFVPALSKSCMFGGSTPTGPGSDTYEYQTNTFAAFTGFGNSCSGTSGAPALSASSLPWLGSALQIQAGGLSPSSLAILLMGFSNTSWAGGALPFQLSLVYSPTAANCQLLVRPDAKLLLLNVGGSAQLGLVIPNNPALVGTNVQLQGLQLEFNGTMSVTGGATMTLGAR